MTLADNELERYSRQLVLPEWSGAAQERLRAASVVVVGAGALGSPATLYLAAAGVGRIGVVDDDDVELSNLNRQILHFSPDVSLRKAENARVKLGALNPHVLVDAYPARLDEANAGALVLGADVVVDCSDTFATRYLVNDACCEQGIPLVEAAVLGFSGQVLSIVPGRSACYRCAFPTEPPPGAVPSCSEAGVLGAMAGIIGSIQALEALKLLTGIGEPLTDTLLQVDGAALRFTAVATHRLEGCPACARVPAASES